jgi:hypothetical protein
MKVWVMKSVMKMSKSTVFAESEHTLCDESGDEYGDDNLMKSDEK